MTTRHGTTRRFVLALAAAGAFAFASVLAACASPSTAKLPTSGLDRSFPDDSLPPDLSFPDDSLGPDESLPPDGTPGPDDSALPSGAFTHGTATITFSTGDPKTIVLPHLAADSASTFETDLGVSLAWRGGDWAIHLDAAVPADSAVQTLFITREDSDPPLSADGSNCTVTFTSETVDKVTGKADCKGLTWSNAFGADGMDLPIPTLAPGATPFARPPFDATITFSATP